MNSTLTAEPLSWRPARSLWRTSLTRLVHGNLIGLVGAAMVAMLVTVAALAPLIATHDQYTLNARERLVSPGDAHWFGTDDLGRDVFSRVVYGARISLYVGFISVSVGIIAGTLIGLSSAYFRGATDFWLQRLVDALFAFPTIILALAIVAVLGPSIQNVIIAVGITSMPRIARVVRSSALSVMSQPYMEAAKAMGCSDLRMMAQHVLPNCMAPIIILATAGFGGAILAEASLSFLGVGTPPPNPSWGAMLSGAAQRYIQIAPWLAVFPGLAITLAVFGFNLFGDALRDVLDPRLRGR